jgi:hypothetical protein
MTIEYCSFPALFPGQPTWLHGTLDAIDNGDYVVHTATGKLLSIQADGRFEEREPTAIGSWERCRPDPNINVLRYRTTVVPYAIPYRAA